MGKLEKKINNVQKSNKKTSLIYLNINVWRDFKITVSIQIDDCSGGDSENDPAAVNMKHLPGMKVEHIWLKALINSYYKGGEIIMIFVAIPGNTRRNKNLLQALFITEQWNKRS